MKLSNKIVATALAAALATTAIATPSYAGAYYHCAPVPPSVSSGGGSSAAPFLLGCIFGSAFGLIAAAYLKKNGQLTTQQAQAIAFSCGLGAVPVIASFTPRP
jgi:hypothetical protein